jgi:hypothetical protein
MDLQWTACSPHAGAHDIERGHLHRGPCASPTELPKQCQQNHSTIQCLVERRNKSEQGSLLLPLLGSTCENLFLFGRRGRSSDGILR